MKSIKGTDFKAFVAEGHSDDEIVAWVNTHGMPKTAAEISAWNAMVSANNYSDNADKSAWLAGEVAKAGLPKGTTLFDWLDADDKTSFAK